MRKEINVEYEALYRQKELQLEEEAKHEVRAVIEEL